MISFNHLTGRLRCGVACADFGPRFEHEADALNFADFVLRVFGADARAWASRFLEDASLVFRAVGPLGTHVFKTHPSQLCFCGSGERYAYKELSGLGSGPDRTVCIRCSNRWTSRLRGGTEDPSWAFREKSRNYLRDTFPLA